MICSFNDKVLATFWKTGKSRKIPSAIQPVLKRKLVQIHVACNLNDLRQPPANRLESLRGDLQGAHSIRVNDQWRLVFLWHESGAHELRLVDYH